MSTVFVPMYEWKNVDWRKVERRVFKLQKRIYRASQRGNVKLVHRLQRLLQNSWYAKLLAVRRVTQDNQGKKTAGIDGIKTLNPKQRMALAENIKVGAKPKPTRRVWIPKAGTDEKRPLGIPTMYERATQALVKLVLEPEWESKFEPNSYGFRPARSAHDAIEAIKSALHLKAKYVLDADITKCFDKINHDKLLTKLQTYPKLRNQIKAWLKSGVMDGETLFNTEEGTPQGGVISPLLANIALHGMEEAVKKFMEKQKLKCGNTRLGRNQKRETIALIRYADDFVVIHENLEIVQECQRIIEEWLADIGLSLKPSKTRITHTLHEYQGNKGFDFLGFHVRQYPIKGKHNSGLNSKKERLGFRTTVKPSKEKIKLHTQKVREVIRECKNAKQATLINRLNPVIKGWTNYYRTVACSQVFSKCSHTTAQQLRAWGLRRHPNKNKNWVIRKYWHSVGNRNWVFKSRNGKTLHNHHDTHKVRHVKVTGTKSPFDGNLTYWSSRLGKHPEMPNGKAALLKRQKGRCAKCGLTFQDGDLMEIDHIIPKSLGGSDKSNNKQLLHRHCHDLKTAQDMTGTHDKSQAVEERNEAKVSRSVLKTSHGGDPMA